MRLERGVSVVLVAVAVFALAWPTGQRWARAADVLSRLSSPGEFAAPLIERELWLPADPPVRARLYRPAQGGRGRGVVIAHGVHFRGIDERRLVPFARELARTGLVVLTPELDDLVDYRISRRAIDVIQQSVAYLAARRDLVSSGRVGVVGFSFAGGLALVAAADPKTNQQVEFVTSVGGHHDLGRVLEFLVSGVVATPNGPKERHPHEYGLVILTYQHLDRFVPEEDREVMREALRAWLQEDRPRARRWASRRTTAEAERLFALLESQKLGELERELHAIIAERSTELDALSPRGRLAEIRAPIYLLHGTGDSVIPASETEWGALELDLASTEHATLVTPLIEHVEVDRETTFGDKLNLLCFMAAFL